MAQTRFPKEHVGLAARLTLSVALIAGLGHYIGSTKIVEQMLQANWEVLLVVIVALASHVLVVAPRWSKILAVLGYPMRVSQLIGSVFLGFLFNQLLPTAVGGDVIRAWRAKELGAPLDLAIHSVLIDRAAGILVVLVGVVLLLPFARASMLPSGSVWIIGALVLLTLVAGAYVLGRVEGITSRIVGGAQRAMAGFNASVGIMLRDPASSLVVLALSVIGQLIVIMATALLARDLQVALPLLDIVVITFFATLAAIVPISVGGWGVREGAMVGMFGLYGVPAESAFAISALFGMSMMLASVPGAFFLLRRRRSKTLGIAER